MEDDDDLRSHSRSTYQYQTDLQTPPPSPLHASVTIAMTPGSGHRDLLGDAGLAAESVTVAVSPNRTLAITPPVQQPRSSGKDFGGREDCWSEGATWTLIGAWGKRYLELERGILKQKHWQEVADAVTSRNGYTKTPKTGIQCKNRIDTLKKKYKIEKSKISGAGSAAATSWPFFHQLDLLFGPKNKPSPVPMPQPASLPSRPKSDQKIFAGVPIMPPSTQMSSEFSQRNWTSNQEALKRIRSSSPPASSKYEDGAWSSDSSDGLPPPPTISDILKRQHRKQKQKQKPPPGGTQEVDEGMMAGLRELTDAIVKLGEVYEIAENSKLQQATEMEKQRMTFSMELEVLRMQFLVTTQMELLQFKSSSPHRGRSKKRRRLEVVDGSSNYNNGNNNNNNNKKSQQ